MAKVMMLSPSCHVRDIEATGDDPPYSPALFLPAKLDSEDKRQIGYPLAKRKNALLESQCVPSLESPPLENTKHLRNPAQCRTHHPPLFDIKYVI